jgi:HAD superfamily hydrolase (TIGR01509 family)
MASKLFRLARLHNEDMTHELKTILFDADGVLQHPTIDYGAAFADLLGSRRPDADRFIAEVFTTERSTLSGIGDFRDHLAALLLRWNVPQDVDQVLSISTQIKPDEAIFAAISALRAAGLCCCLATNQQAYRAHFMSETLGYARHFDREFYSCHVGFAKPEPAYYQAILDDLGCAAKHTLFIDDHEPNVVAARSVGLHGAVFAATPETSGEKLRVILAEHGLSLP